MAADDVVWVPVLPSLRGFANSLSRGTRDAGERAGREAGDAIADGLGRAQSAVNKATEKLARAQDKVSDATGRQRVEQQKLEDLQNSGRATAAQLAAAEERVEAARRGVRAATRNATTATNDLADANDRAARAQRDAGDAGEQGARGVRSFGDDADAAGGKLKNLAVAAAGIGSAVELGLAAIDNQAVTNKLAASLGATGELGAEYGQITGDLYKNAFGDSMEDVSTAVGAVASSFRTAGFEGEASIEQISEKAMNFAGIFGGDVTESVQSAAQLVTNGLAKDSTEAFDLMTAAAQRVPAAMRDELPEIMNEYGTNFRALGFEGDAAFGVLVAASDNGKIALDKTGDALKEFTIRGSDMSTASVAAYERVGLNAEAMSAAIAGGGAEAQQALRDTASGLLSIEDPAERANTAIALFGTPLEDLSVDQIPAFLEGLTGAEANMAGFEGSAAAAGETLRGGAGVALEEFSRTVKGGLVGSLGTMAGFLMDNAGALQSLAIAVAPLAGTLLAIVGGIKAWTIAQAAFNIVMNANPIMLIVTGLGLLAAGLIYAYRESETFRNIVHGAMNAVGAVFSWLYDTIIAPIMGWFGDRLREAGAAATWLYDNAIQPAMNGIGSAIETGVRIGSGALDALKSAMGAVGDFFGSVGQTISGVWDNIVIGIKRAVGNIGRVLQRIQIPDWVPGVGGMGTKGLGDSLVSWAAPYRDGGRVTGPGGPRDDAILARLSNGEFVEPAHAVTPETLPVLEAIRGGWVPSAEFLHGMLPGYADGGLVTTGELIDFARGVEGAEYEWGGVNWGDCSGAVSALANFATGRSPFGSRFATGNQESALAAMGAIPGVGPAGSLSFGWYNGGPYGGHTAATLPDGTHFEMGGARGDGQFGGIAAGADDPMFSDHAHFPPEFFVGGDAMPDGTVGGPASGTGGVSGIGGTFDAPAPVGSAPSSTGGSSSAGTSAGMSSAGASSSTSGAYSAQEFEGFLHQLPRQIFDETVGDTLDFFGLGKLGDIAFDLAESAAAPALSSAPALGEQPATPTDAEGAEGAGGDGERGPLVFIEQLITNNPEEAAQEMSREARRLVRSDALAGGW
ncbi:phage tail tape measure protein [Rhodococcoides fascians]|uniref:phage tail tape measure protein n=1 Tax=Rhodococcoides fascians TaxID=1828 RepID=UPI000567050B|nr:phage tail tape measure protein [Rhodococcus fascians]